MPCQFVKTDGSPCLADPQTDSKYCLWHDPWGEVKEARLEASRRGGRSSRRADAPVDIPIDLTTPEAILTTLQATARAVVAGEIDRSRANAVGYLAKTAGETIKALQHERRLRKVEERLGLRDPAPEGGDG